MPLSANALISYNFEYRPPTFLLCASYREATLGFCCIPIETHTLAVKHTNAIQLGG